MSQVSTIEAREVIVRAADARPVHVIDNRDLSVILRKGNTESELGIANDEDTGIVVISLGVDGGQEPGYGHDEVHVEPGRGLKPVDVIEQAIASLEASRDALRRLEGS